MSKLERLSSETRDATSDHSRMRFNSIVCLLLWCITVTLLVTGGPFWSVIATGAAGCCFALRDRRQVRPIAHQALWPSHPGPDVQALIDQRIDIGEYRRK